MPSLVSLPKKLIPSILRKKKNDTDADEPEDAMDPDNVQFEVPTPDHSPTREVSQEELGMDAEAGVDKEEIAKLIADHGSSANTSWLEFSRYKLWVSDKDIAPSSFRPVQGYLRNDPYVFAWGNPLVSDPAALEPTCLEFWRWCKERKLKIVWCCVDDEMERVLGKGSKFGWSTVSCIVEDVLDPHNVVELAQSTGGGSEVKDFKKNIRRAEREGVEAREIKWDGWTDAQKKEVEAGIVSWKDAKQGMQLASVRPLAFGRLMRALIELRRHRSSRGLMRSIADTGSRRRTRRSSAFLSSRRLEAGNTKSRMRRRSLARRAGRPSS
jgi:hypothetical protein